AVSDDGKRVVLVAGDQTFFVGDQTEPSTPDSLGGRWRSFVLRGPDDGSSDGRSGFRSLGQSVQSLWLAGDGSRLIAHEANDRLRHWNLDTNPDYARTWAPSMTLEDGKTLVGTPGPGGYRVAYAPQPRPPFATQEEAPTRTVIIRDVMQKKEIQRYELPG